ncbi:hypothetical protein DK37_29630 [Halomonas sp. SUBG004]|nr:hypothetical protein DK37_29630 [Halomonas sp. SUBG004]
MRLFYAFFSLKKLLVCFYFFFSLGILKERLGLPFFLRYWYVIPGSFHFACWLLDIQLHQEASSSFLAISTNPYSAGGFYPKMKSP